MITRKDDLRKKSKTNREKLKKKGESNLSLNIDNSKDKSDDWQSDLSSVKKCPRNYKKHKKTASDSLASSKSVLKLIAKKTKVEEDAKKSQDKAKMAKKLAKCVIVDTFELSSDEDAEKIRTKIIVNCYMDMAVAKFYSGRHECPNKSMKSSACKNNDIRNYFLKENYRKCVLENVTQ